MTFLYEGSPRLDLILSGFCDRGSCLCGICFDKNSGSSTNPNLETCSHWVARSKSPFETLRSIVGCRLRPYNK